MREYLSLSRWGRLKYRLYRHPLVLIFLGPPVHFLVLQRVPVGMALPGNQSRLSIVALDLALVTFYGLMAWWLGPALAALVFVPTILVAAWAGGWLFFVQHQFEETAWDYTEGWDQQVHALVGSSYYVMPKVLQWFTGNIGLHHVHHLNSRIPNYRLQECIDAAPELAQVNRLGLLESLKCANLALWDEANRRLIRFRDLADLRAA